MTRFLFFLLLVCGLSWADHPSMLGVTCDWPLRTVHSCEVLSLAGTMVIGLWDSFSHCPFYLALVSGNEGLVKWALEYPLLFGDLEKL